MPYVSSTSLNNGVDGYIGNNGGVRKFSDCLTLANSGSVGCTFFHQYEFVASDHVTQLKREGLDKYAYLFLAPIVSRLSEKYGFNREINDERIKREKLLLPTTDDGQIDFTFMSSFMQDVEKDILNKTLKTFKARLTVNKPKLGGVNLEQNDWKIFPFTTIFDIKDGYYNKKPPFDRHGNIPFLGATQYDNGITAYYSVSTIEKYDKVGTSVMDDKDRRLFKGNCIAITNNGSVGNAYYQETDFTCSHDVTPIYLKGGKTLSRHIALFLIPLIKKAGESFEYAKKWRPKRMRKSKILLPVTNEGEPDFEFMELYMRHKESEDILKILRYYMDGK